MLHEAEAEIALLRHALAAALDKDDAGEPDAGSVDWTVFADRAQHAKCLLIAAAGLDRMGLRLPETFRERANRGQHECLARNMANLATAARLVRILDTHGIEAIAFKGVLRSFAVYGRWNARVAHDLDLLVETRDYRVAGAVLEANGFDAACPPMSRWWHRDLGESPYLPSSPGAPIVDLHHRLQQPGAPAPERLDPLFARARHFELGGYRIRTLDPLDAAMVTASGYAKALRAGESWLVYAHELAAVLAASDEAQRRALDRHAERSGMDRLWREAASVAHDLFLATETGEAGARRADLMRSALGDAAGGRRWAVRSELLWRWTDGRMRRPLRFAAEMVRVRRSDHHHDAEEETNRRAAIAVLERRAASGSE